MRPLYWRQKEAEKKQGDRRKEPEAEPAEGRFREVGRRMGKAENMFAILLLLMARNKMTARELAEELEVHIRTVYRCIDALSASGVPIAAEPGRDGGYYILPDAKLNPLFFDAEEQGALLHAARFVRDSGYPHEEALNRAVAKIKRHADEERLRRLTEEEEGLEVVHFPCSADLSETLAELERAAVNRTTLELEYYSGTEGTYTKRGFDPYGLVNWRGRWYAVGFCHLRGEIRTLRADRIGRIRRTGEVFERPASFSAGRHLLESLRPYGGRGFRGTGFGAEAGAAAEAGAGADAGAAGAGTGAEEGGAPAGGTVTVRIAGSPQALDELCGHWLFGCALAGRSREEAEFRLDERSLYGHASWYLLSYGGPDPGPGAGGAQGAPGGHCRASGGPSPRVGSVRRGPSAATLFHHTSFTGSGSGALLS